MKNISSWFLRSDQNKRDRMFLSLCVNILYISVPTCTAQRTTPQSSSHQLVLNIPTGQHNAVLRTLLALIGVKPFSNLSVCPSSFLSSPLFQSSSSSSDPSLPPLHPLSAPLPAVLIIFCPSFLLLASVFVDSSESVFLPPSSTFVLNLQINAAHRSFTDEQIKTQFKIKKNHIFSVCLVKKKCLNH